MTYPLMVAHLPVRPAAALLSRAALSHNFRIIKERIRTQTYLHHSRADMMAVVKADAYGHDLKQVLPALEKKGVNKFLVASIEEGIEARKLSKSAMILAVGGTFDFRKSTFDLIRKHRLQIGINDLSSLQHLCRHPDISIHLKLDTGMNRLGIKPEQWSEAIHLIQKSRRHLEGLYTHFATAGDAPFFRQARIFQEAVRWFLALGIKPRWIHSEASASLFSSYTIKKDVLSEVANLVRPGVSMYGYISHGITKTFGLKPVLELVSQIGLVKSADKGEGISYDHIYRAEKNHFYGVVPLGYADGLSKQYRDFLNPRIYNSLGRLKGKARICGTICMDMVMVRGHHCKLARGDRVVFWGRFPNPMIHHGVVGPYELNLRISKRIPRLWVP